MNQIHPAMAAALAPWIPPKPKAIGLLVDGIRGQYAPLAFIQNHAHSWDGICEADKAVILAGPDHPHYAESWEIILDSASFTCQGYTYYLHHDDDLWAVCNDLLEDGEFEEFFGSARA